MFTGIIQATGRVVKLRVTRHGRFIVIKTDPRIVQNVFEGGSVSVDGVCLTSIVYRSAAFHVPPKRGTSPRATRGRGSLSFKLMDSTLKLTTLGARKVGDRVNVEPAMRASDRVGGHFVTGHVDGVGVIKNVKCKMKNGTLLTVRVPNRLARYIVPQGSITVNGVSLTVVEVTGSYKKLQEVTRGYRGTFSVALTRYTAEHTNLGTLKAGEQVNIEVDMFAKYIFNFLNHYGSYAKISHRRG